MRALAAAIALAMALAGCVRIGGADVVADPVALAPVAVDMSLGGCVELGSGMFVSFDHARSLLPPGFEPADAAGFLGMPAPAGRAVVLSGHLTCESSVPDGGAPVAWADLIVPIAPPDVPGVAPTGGIDVYQLAQYTSGTGTFDLLASVGFAVVLADVAVESARVPVAPGGRAATTVDGVDALAFEVAGALPQPFRLDARFWHDAPGGLVYVDHLRTPTPLVMGTLSACAAAEGSLFADAFGTSNCAGPDSIGGVFREPSDFASALYALPGVHVAP